MIDLYIIGYVLIALGVSIRLRSTTFDGYHDDLVTAITCGVLWIITIPIWIYMLIVEVSSNTIRGDK
jgi:hypothetical protein